MPRKKQNLNQNRRFRKGNRYPKKRYTRDLVSDKEITRTGNPTRDMVLYKGIGLPNIFATKLKYSQTLTFSGVPYYEYLYRINSVYDPDYSGAGNQPMYFDQLANIYNRYCVYGSKVKLTFISKSSGLESQYTKCGVYPLVDVATASGLPMATERDNCTFTQLSSSQGDQGVISMESFAKPHNVFGIPSTDAGSDDYSAAISTNPARNCYWHIFAGTLDGITNVTLYVDVVVTYYVRFYELYQTSRS